VGVLCWGSGRLGYWDGGYEVMAQYDEHIRPVVISVSCRVNILCTDL
jgi:hypothetical protein